MDGLEVNMKDIVYPTNATMREKHFACRDLIERYLLIHNNVAEGFRNRLVLEPAPENPQEYKKKQEGGFIPEWVPEGLMVSDSPENNTLKAKFWTYYRESKAILKKLLAERNRLMENIRWANYTLEQWRAVSKLSIEEQDAIYHKLFVDKEIEEVKPTEATSHLLYELESLNLDDMGESKVADPPENLATYTEFDLNDHINRDMSEWLPYSGNPILVPVGAEDRIFITGVEKDGAIYNFFYTYVGAGGTRVIGRATSNDGRTLTKDGVNNPILEKGPPGKFDDNGITAATAWKEGTGAGCWRMLFTGINTLGAVAIGYATADNPEGPWTKQNSGNAVIEGGIAEWDEDDVETAGIMKVGSTYYCWYSKISVVRKTGLATSTDLINWTKDVNNPIFDSERFIANPFKYGGTYYLLIPHATNPPYYAEFELYRDSSPTFHVGDRTFVGIARTYASAGWDSYDIDAPYPLTDDIERDSYGASGNEMWCYYSGRTLAGDWSGGLLIESNIGNALSGRVQRVNFTDLGRDEDAWLYYDKGLGHFNGNFLHREKCYAIHVDSSGLAVVWMLANTVDDLKGIIDASEDSLSLSLADRFGLGYLRFELTECDGGATFSDLTNCGDFDTTYFVEIERDESVGLHGTLYAYICKDDYYHDGGTLEATISTVLHTNKKDFRDIYAVNTYNDSVALAISGWVDPFDLGETPARAGKNPFADLLGGGFI